MALNSDKEPRGCAAASRGVSLTSTTRRGDPKFAVVGGGLLLLGYLFSSSLWCVWPRTEIYGGG